MLRILTNAVANLTNVLRIKQQHDTCVAYLHIHIAGLSFCYSLSTFFHYTTRISIRMQANLYKRLKITKNALLVIRMAWNCLRICCEYASLKLLSHQGGVLPVIQRRPKKYRTPRCAQCERKHHRSNAVASPFDAAGSHRLPSDGGHFEHTQNKHRRLAFSRRRGDTVRSP